MRPNAKATRRTGLRGAACGWLVDGWAGRQWKLGGPMAFVCGRGYAGAVVYVQWLAVVQWCAKQQKARAEQRAGLRLGRKDYCMWL
jgi:hypothetical protein